MTICFARHWMQQLVGGRPIVGGDAGEDWEKVLGFLCWIQTQTYSLEEGKE